MLLKSIYISKVINGQKQNGHSFIKFVVYSQGIMNKNLHHYGNIFTKMTTQKSDM